MEQDLQADHQEHVHDERIAIRREGRLYCSNVHVVQVHLIATEEIILDAHRMLVGTDINDMAEPVEDIRLLLLRGLQGELQENRHPVHDVNASRTYMHWTTPDTSNKADRVRKAKCGATQ